MYIVIHNDKMLFRSGIISYLKKKCLKTVIILDVMMSDEIVVKICS